VKLARGNRVGNHSKILWTRLWSLLLFCGCGEHGDKFSAISSVSGRGDSQVNLLG